MQLHTYGFCFFTGCVLFLVCMNLFFLFLTYLPRGLIKTAINQGLLSMADQGRARTPRAGGNHGGGGNPGMAFTESELNNLMDISGDIVPIGPIEWAAVVDHHRILFANRNRDVSDNYHI